MYPEDQYLWSSEVGRVLHAALRRAPQLQIVAVRPRYPDQEGLLKVPPSLLGQGLALRTLSPRVRDRVTLLDLGNAQGWPIYVHAKLNPSRSARSTAFVRSRAPGSSGWWTRGSSRCPRP